MSVSHIASFSARIGSVAVTPRGFGTPMLLGYHTNFAADSKSYTGSSSDILSALVTDGFTAGTAIHEMARVMLSQETVPRTIKVGRLATAHDQSVKFTPIRTTEGSVYSLAFELNGNTDTATYTVQNGDAAADIATALHTAINAFSNVTVTSTDNTGSINVSPDTNGDTFRCLVTVDGRKGDPATMDVADETTAPAGLADRLTAINNADSDWYFALVDCCSDAIGNVVGDWAATNEKFFWGAVSDADATESGTTTDLMSDMVADSNDRVSCFWDGKICGYANAAIVGKMASKTPGSATWVNQPLRQVTTPDISPSLYSNLDTKRYTTYRSVSSPLSVTKGGHVGGTFLKADVTRGLDWLVARSSEAIANLLISADKIPYTIGGLEAVRGALQRVVDLGIANGLLSAGEPGSETNPPPAVVMPLLSEVTTADKGARRLRGVKITGVLAGAIETLISGDIVVQF